MFLPSRIEPLLCQQYSSVAPVVIHSYNAGEKIPYSELPLEPIIVTKDKDKDAVERNDSGNNTPVSSVPSTPSKGQGKSCVFLLFFFFFLAF